MKLFFLLSALVILSGCSVALKGIYITEKKDFWFDKDGHETGDGLYYCKAHDDINEPKPVCYLARSVKPAEGEKSGETESRRKMKPIEFQE